WTPETERRGDPPPRSGHEPVRATGRSRPALAQRSPRRVLHLPRSEWLGQVDEPPHDSRPGTAGRRPYPDRGAGRGARAALAPEPGYGLPALRDLPPHDGGRERELRAPCAPAPPRRDRRQGGPAPRASRA